ncbi:MAG: ribonuclease HII [Niabella sp.]
MKPGLAKLENCFNKNLYEAGCDEAGRGCYAGPVFAAAVILPLDFYHVQLNDSKQIKPAVRNLLRIYIEEHALAWAVAKVDVKEIDTINILKASQKAMHLALEALSITPQHIGVDGNYFIPYKNIPHTCIVKGDGKYANIAAASILAKTHRDAYMQKLHISFPQYNWEKNKGYGTAEHRNAIENFGLCKHHRKSFKITPTQIEIF